MRLPCTVKLRSVFWQTVETSKAQTYALLLLFTGASILTLAFGPPLARILLAGSALLTPGYLLWARAGQQLHLPPLAQIGIWVALSVSVIPLVFLWSSLFGLTLSPLVLFLLLVAGVLMSGWQLAQGPIRRPAPPWLAAGILCVAALALGVRLYQIREVALPLWVDSVHHALLIRVTAETGRIPLSLRPYVAVDRLPYHWGYHAVVATWQAAARLPLPPLMLLSGQALNALNVLTVYSLAAYLSRSPLAGLIAALATGLLSMMPAFYVTWGRYTQLTGLLILPALLILSCMLIERPTLSLPLLGCAALALAGLFLVHYRVLIFYGAFLLPFACLFALKRPARIGAMLGRLAGMGAMSTLLVLPWLLVLFQRVLLPAARRPATLVGEGSYNSVDPDLLWRPTNNPALFAVATAGLLLALGMRRWRMVAVGAWVGLLFLIANPGIARLPSLWIINNHSVVITLFLPASLLAAFGVREIVRFLMRRRLGRFRRVVHGLLVLLFLILAGLGLWQFRNVINPVTSFATRADLEAVLWAETHTPADARFLIGATRWLGDVYRGTDGGWWLTPLAGRWTSTPPSLYSYGAPRDVAEVKARSAAVAQLQPDQLAQLDHLIRANRITHIFLGEKDGPLKPEMFWGRPGFEAVYDHDGVLIFEVQQP